MKRKGYIFTNKKHPLPAIMSTVLGTISILSLVYAVVSAYRSTEEISIRYGYGCMLSMIYSLVGIVIPLFVFQSKDYYKFFPVLGLILNGVSLLAGAFLLWLAG